LWIAQYEALKSSQRPCSFEQSDFGIFRVSLKPHSFPPLPLPSTPVGSFPTKIDKSQLGIAEPKRLRDKAHLKFVASQPCLVCGRQPSDSLHLRFAQPRAIGLKVSDESTVPLCRGRHRELHQVGIEEDWWAKYQIDTLEMVKHLWEQNHLQRT
jgi:hypothetical protein